MTSQLENKVAIVTGGSQGVGAAVVSLFLSHGAKVASFDVAAPSKIPEGDSFLHVSCDISKEDFVNDAVASVIAKWGRIDVLVNNAGITDDNKSVADSSISVWRRVMGINLDGPMFLMRAVIPHMLQNESSSRGAIVNVCSVAAATGAAAGAAYTSAKHALLGLTRNTAWMHGNDGIRCNAVLPGGVRTNIVQNSGSMINTSDFGRLGPYMALCPGISEPDQVASAILFLVVNEAVNAAELSVDKGWLAV